MFCTSCGKSVPDDSTFCPYCGGKIIIPQVQSTFATTPAVTPSATTKAKTSKAPIIILSILLIAAVAGAIYFFSMCQTQSTAITELNNTVNSLNETINSQEATINSQKTTISNYEPKAKGFDVIAKYGSASYNKGYALANFKADKDIIVVRKGATASFTLTAYLSGGVSISDSVADSSIASIIFDANSWYTSVGITVRGLKQGATTVTFSNSAGSSTFTMLIIVV